MQNITFGLALASAVMGGVFFTFSTFVMSALGKLRPAEGIRAMQRINIDVFCWPFIMLFFGLPALLLAVAIYSGINHSWESTGYLMAASAAYWIGTFLLTIFGNVPLNNKLARIDPDAKNSEAVWEHYLVYWVRWNHVRTLASVVSSVLLLLALR